VLLPGSGAATPAGGSGATAFFELPTEKRGPRGAVGAESGPIVVSDMRAELRGDVLGPLTANSPGGGDVSSGANGCNGRSFGGTSGDGSDCLGVRAPGGGSSEPSAMVAARDCAS